MTNDSGLFGGTWRRMYPMKVLLALFRCPLLVRAAAYSKESVHRLVAVEFKYVQLVCEHTAGCTPPLAWSGLYET